MKVYAWLIDLIHCRKIASRGWFPGESKKRLNITEQYSIWMFATEESEIDQHGGANPHFFFGLTFFNHDTWDIAPK